MISLIAAAFISGLLDGIPIGFGWYISKYVRAAIIVVFILGLAAIAIYDPPTIIELSENIYLSFIEGFGFLLGIRVGEDFAGYFREALDFERL